MFYKIIASITFIVSALANAQSPYLSTREIFLSTYKDESLKQDLPAKALAFSEQNLWIAGNSSLWRWNLQSQNLSRVQLLTDAQKSVTCLDLLLPVENKLYVAAGNHLFQIDAEPFKVLKFSLPVSEQNTRNVGLFADQEKVFLVTSHSVYVIEGKQRTLQLWQTHPSLGSDASALLLAQEKKLFFVDKNQFFVVNYEDTPTAAKLLYKTKHDFVDLKISGEFIFAHTRYTVLVFSMHGDLLKVVPVEDNRKLVRMDLSATDHSYLFHDRLFERHTLVGKGSFYSQLDLGRVKRAGPMVVHRSIIAMILDGNPRVFQMEGQWQ